MLGLGGLSYEAEDVVTQHVWTRFSFFPSTLHIGGVEGAMHEAGSIESLGLGHRGRALGSW